jgi:hypothetical protein
MEALRDFIGINSKMTVENLKTALQNNFEQKKLKYDTQR